MGRTMMLLRATVAVSLCMLVTLVAGCGRESKSKIVPVDGKIHFANGKTLPAGTLLLFNPSAGGASAATGVTADDGAFKLVHASGQEGAELGKYAVLLRAPSTPRSRPRPSCGSSARPLLALLDGRAGLYAALWT